MELTCEQLFEKVLYPPNNQDNTFKYNNGTDKKRTELVCSNKKYMEKNIAFLENNYIPYFQEKIIEKQNESLQQALLEAKAIREKAEESSKKERELSLEKTKEEASRILENTKKEIELDFQRSKNELISQVGNITIDLTKKVLKKEVSKETHQELLNSYIETIK